MDPIKNPFSPGAGSPPPELVGRDAILDQARILLGRVKERRSEKSMLLNGLRGVGKTVLLNEIGRLAVNEGYRIISIEASEDKSLAAAIAPHLRTLLLDFDRISRAAEKVRFALRVLRSFIGTMTLTTHGVAFGLDIEPQAGVADSGDLDIDLTALLVSIGEAANERQVAVAILIDEIQYFRPREIGALLTAMHKVQQMQLPLVLLGAGLPILPRLAGESKSYAERLLSFPEIGALSEADAGKALHDPARAAGVIFDESALKEIFQHTKGYPYFVQEWGYQTWNIAESSPITRATVQAATALVLPRLDQNFFRVRFDRLTPAEKHFLRAMADSESSTRRTADVAERLQVKITRLGPMRAQLMKKGMIYSPAHGELTFTDPLFAEFMIRTMPEFHSS